MIDATGADDPRPDPQREWWSPREVSKLYRVHITTVYRWIEIGKLKVSKIRRNVYRIRREDVMALAGAPATCKDCRKSDGWLSDDLECGINIDPMCDYHQGKLEEAEDEG